MQLPTLYKRAVNGKISTWYVEVKDECFRTVSGYLDGQKVTSEWTCCEAKNIGKKNETNPAEQADAEALAMWTKRKALGYWESIDDIDNSVYFEPMLAKDWEKKKRKVKYPIYSQPKLDGIRCIVRSDGMWSRNGKPIISAPHIFESLKPLFEQNPELILDGELYADKATTDFNTIISCVRKTKPTTEDLKTSAECIEYHIYDLPSSDKTFIKRMYDLGILFETQPALHLYCKIVATYTVGSEEAVMNNYRMYVDQGYEGQILRIDAPYENKRSKNLLKHKSFVDGEFEIKGVEEGKGNLSGKVGRLNFEINGKPFDAAVNGDWEYIEKLWHSREGLVGKMATVKYFELTEDGVPRFPKVIAIRDFE